MGMLSNKTGMLSNKMGMLSTKMGVLSTEMGGRVSEKPCVGCSPKGPRQPRTGEGLGMGQTENPNPIHRANFPGAAFVRPPFSVRMATALAQSHFLRAEPRERRRQRHSRPTLLRVPAPVPIPAWPLRESLLWAFGLILCSQAMLLYPHRRSGGGHVWHGCCGDGGTRNSPRKRFLTPLPILAARVRHVPNLSHSPPKLSTFSPPMNISLGPEAVGQSQHWGLWLLET